MYVGSFSSAPMFVGHWSSGSMFSAFIYQCISGVLHNCYMTDRYFFAFLPVYQKLLGFAVFDQSGNFVIYATMLGIKGTSGFCLLFKYWYW